MRWGILMSYDGHREINKNGCERFSFQLSHALEAVQCVSNIIPLIISDCMESLATLLSILHVEVCKRKNKTNTLSTIMMSSV